MIFGGCAIPPRAVRVLPGGGVEHPLAGNLEEAGGAGQRAHLTEQCSAQHVRIVNGALLEHDVAEAGPSRGALAGEGHDPVTDTARYLQVLGIAKDAMGLEERLADEAAPD